MQGDTTPMSGTEWLKNTILFLALKLLLPLCYTAVVFSVVHLIVPVGTEKPSLCIASCIP